MNTIRISGVTYRKDNLKLFLLNHPSEDEWIQMIYQFLIDWFSESEHIELKTSGSTGEPKTIAMSKQAMVHSAQTTCAFFGLQSEHTALLCLPATYIAGKMMMVRAIVGGFNLLITPPSANPFVDKFEEIDFTALTPHQMEHSLFSLKEQTVRTIILGGSPVSATLEAKLQHVNTDIFETYGMTETVSHIALRKLNGKDQSTYFSLLPGIAIRMDHRGCLIINAPALFAGELITNDLVDLKDDGHFRWLGRVDNVINSGGIKIFPEQVEKKLETIILAPFAIIAIPDEVLGQKVILAIEGNPLEKNFDRELKSKMAPLLNEYEIPKHIVCLNQFPKTLSGKTNRPALELFCRTATFA